MPSTRTAPPKCREMSSCPRRHAGRGKLKEDGVNISDWLTALCLFAGHAAKNYPGVDLVALAQYLTNQLRAGEGLDLLLLKELVSVMTACPHPSPLGC